VSSDLPPGLLRLMLAMLAILLAPRLDPSALQMYADQQRSRACALTRVGAKQGARG